MISDLEYKRQSFTLQIRKQKRFQFFEDHRQKLLKRPPNMSQDNLERFSQILDEQHCQTIHKLLVDSYDLDQLSQLIYSLLEDDDYEICLRNLIGIKKILATYCSLENIDSVISILVQGEILQIVQQFLKENTPLQLKYQAIQIFTYISCSERYFTYLVHPLNIIHYLEQLLSLSKKQILLQVMLIIRNVAISSEDLFNFINKKSLFHKILSVSSNYQNRSIKSTSIQLIKILVQNSLNHCDAKIDEFKAIFDYLFSSNLTQEIYKEDNETVFNYLWSMIYLCELFPIKTIQHIFTFSIHQSLINQLCQQIKSESSFEGNKKTVVITRVLGEICLSSDGPTQLLNADILKPLNILIEKQKCVLLEGICWLLSNLATCERPQQILNDSICEKMLKIGERLFQVDVWWFCYNLYDGIERKKIFHEKGKKIKLMMKRLSRRQQVQEEIKKYEKEMMRISWI